jgi:hypothetical protein
MVLESVCTMHARMASRHVALSVIRRKLLRAVDMDVLGRLEEFIRWFRTLQQWQKIIMTIFMLMLLAVFYSLVMFMINWQIDTLISSVFNTVATLFILAVLYLIAHFLGLFGKLLDRLGVHE